MASRLQRTGSRGSRKSSRGIEESPWIRRLLISIALGFSGLFLVLPLVNVFAQALADGWGAFGHAIADPDTVAAIRLTFLVALITVPLNLVFGIAAAWCIARFEFPGKPLLLTLIDLPFSVSPVVAGLVYVILFGLQGYLGEWLDARNIRIIFATPGIVLASLFVTLPFIARELIPLMQAQGSESEQAALTLGASGWQVFWHVTLPSIRWALLYGVILCTSRAMGEFGAVSVVSGNITGLTDTLPLRVEKLYMGMGQGAAAFAVASLLTLLALITLLLKTYLEWRHERDLAHAQSGPTSALPPPTEDA